MGARLHRDRRAFTLIELLVVIAIIIIIATISLVLITALTKGQAVKAGSRETQSAFAKARQLAAAQRVPHILVFWNNQDPQSSLITGEMQVYKDVDRDNVYQPLVDQPVDNPIELPKGLRFHLRGSNQLPTQATQAWLVFLSDGSIIPDNNYFPNPPVASSTFDNAFITGTLAVTNPNNWDIVIEQVGTMGKMYMNYTPPTGRIRKPVYWEN